GWAMATSTVAGASRARLATARAADDPQAPSTVPLRPARSASASGSKPSADWNKRGRSATLSGTGTAAGARDAMRTPRRGGAGGRGGRAAPRVFVAAGARAAPRQTAARVGCAAALARCGRLGRFRRGPGRLDRLGGVVQHLDPEGADVLRRRAVVRRLGDLLE